MFLGLRFPHDHPLFEAILAKQVMPALFTTAGLSEPFRFECLPVSVDDVFHLSPCSSFVGSQPCCECCTDCDLKVGSFSEATVWLSNGELHLQNRRPPLGGRLSYEIRLRRRDFKRRVWHDLCARQYRNRADQLYLLPFSPGLIFCRHP